MAFKSRSVLLAIAGAVVLPFYLTLAAWADMGTLTTRQPGDRVNIRESPSTNARVRHYGLGGDRVEILNTTNAPDGFVWYFVEFPNSGARGWVRGDLITLSGTSPQPNAQRITFAPGTSAATVTGRVRHTQVNTYLLNARAGQTLSTSLTSNSPFLQVLLIGPNRRTLYIGSGQSATVLPTTGDYTVQVRVVPEEQNTRAGQYSLTISIR